MKAVIISRPKAGTYLCGQFLEELDMTQTYYHLLGGVAATAYDGKNLAEGRKKPSKFNKQLGDLQKAIPENGFFATHVFQVPTYSNAFKPFKKIVLTRDVKECQKSARRFANETGRRYVEPEKFNVENWLSEDVFHLEFNDLVNINITKLDELQVFLFGRVEHSSLLAMERALNKKTLTKSSIRKGDNW